MGSGSGLGSCCAKTILIITNILFFLIGLAFFAAGIAIKFASQYIQPYVDQLTASIPSIGAGAGLANSGSASGSVTIDIATVLADFAIAFIVVGVFIMVVAVLGMCGACCTSRCMLITYAIIIFLLFVIQLAVVIIIATGVLNDKIKEQLKVIVTKKYGGLDKFDPESLMLNFIMLQFKCCGVDGYGDFNDAEKWEKVRTVNVTYNGQMYQQNVNLTTPIACCVMNGTFPAVTPKDDQCAITPTDTINNWKKGCFKEASTSIVNSYKGPLIGAVAGVLVFELILGILAIVISKATTTDSKVNAF